MSQSQTNPYSWRKSPFLRFLLKSYQGDFYPRLIKVLPTAGFLSVHIIHYDYETSINTHFINIIKKNKQLKRINKVREEEKAINDLSFFISMMLLPASFSLFFTSNRSRGRDMSCQNLLLSNLRKLATLRLSKVSGHTTELLEIQSDKPTFHVLFIPGNPGVVSFYKEFLESLYELLGGSASVTAIGHISHTEKNWEHGKLFSLQDQIDHKVDFIKQELQNNELPIVLVGHSIGSYISLEILRSCLEKVIYLIGLYPFLMLNPLSKQQSNIENVAESSILSALLSFSVASLGLLPQCTLRFIMSKSIGSSWSDTAIDAGCSHLLQYHTFRNMLYMALTEFRKLSEMPDWAFMRENHEKIAFLFGVDDHWGPLQMFEEISKQVPDIALSIEREGHTHSFCCTEAGSEWVAQHVASLIKKKISS